MPEIEANGSYFISKLKSIASDNIKDVRGKGLMVALELHKNGETITSKCADKGLLINCINGKILRFLPPLTITKDEIDICVAILDNIICEGDLND